MVFFAARVAVWTAFSTISAWGQEFVCVGSGPFWRLEINGSNAQYKAGEGPQSALTGSLFAIVPGTLSVWRGKAREAGEVGDLVAIIRQDACVQSAPRPEYPFSVALSFADGKLLHGCCRGPQAPIQIPVKVTGKVSLVQGSALSPNAVVEVKLLDITLPDAPSKVIAEQTIKNGPQVPVAFELLIDPRAIKPENQYVIHARITESGRLLFISLAPPPVLTGGNPSEVEVLVKAIDR